MGWSGSAAAAAGLHGTLRVHGNVVERMTETDTASAEAGLGICSGRPNPSAQLSPVKLQKANERSDNVHHTVAYLSHPCR